MKKLITYIKNIIGASIEIYLLQKKELDKLPKWKSWVNGVAFQKGKAIKKDQVSIEDTSLIHFTFC